jgi:hypothetical protein
MKLSVDEVLALFAAIDRGEVTVRALQDPERDLGDIEHVTSNGWRVVVFNDCDSWDYVASVTAPDGRHFECYEDDDVSTSEIDGEHPKDPVRCYEPKSLHAWGWGYLEPATRRIRRAIADVVRSLGWRR